MDRSASLPWDLLERLDSSQTISTIVGGLLTALLIWVGVRLRSKFQLFIRWVKKNFRELMGLRLTTHASRAALIDQGYSQRSAEVNGERARAPRPSWMVTERHGWGDEVHVLHNSGYAVRDVLLEADPQFFAFASEAYFKGRFGDNRPGGATGRQFFGSPTELGRKEGVRFSVTWTDDNGDRQPSSSVEKSTGEVLFRPSRPVVQPTWQFGRPHGAARDEFVLLNGAPGFVGKNITIDADPEFFTFTKTKNLGDMIGNGRLHFTGRLSSVGEHFGFEFVVSYIDVNGEKKTDEVPSKQ